MSYIEIKNLSFSYNSKKIFKNVSCCIKKGNWVSILGSNSSGKSTFLNLISGSITTFDSIYIDGIELNSKDNKTIVKRMTFFNPCTEFYSKTVLDELLLEFSNNNSSNLNVIKKLLKNFNMLGHITSNIQLLTYIERQKLNLIKAIIRKSEILLIDNIFAYFDNYSKLEFIGLLKKYQLENKLTIIYTSNDLNDIIFSDKIIVISNTKIVFDDFVDKIYFNEPIIKKANLNIPILNELFEKLRLYGLIDNSICTIDGLVDEICK